MTNATALSNKATALCIFLLSFLAFAYFSPQNGSWQVTTRLGLTLSLVQSGTLSIDPYADKTGDKAQVGEHYYADKAPGQSFLAVPVVAITQSLLRASGTDPSGTNDSAFQVYARVATIFVTSLIAALGAATVYLAAVQLGAARLPAMIGSLAIGFGTPYFGYSTTFMAHALGGGLLVIFFTLASPVTALSDFLISRRPVLSGIVVGLVAALTATVDFTMVPPIMAMSVVFLGFALSNKVSGTLAFVVSTVIAGACGIIPLAIYNTLAFGSPTNFGYANVVGFGGMHTGFFGISSPKAFVFWEILLGLKHGLLPLSPILFFVPYGCWRMWTEKRSRPAVVAILAAVIVALCINAGYVYWSGGKALGPRHIVAILPLCGIVLAFAWPRTRLWKIVFVALLCVSIVFGVLGAAVTIFPSTKAPNPIVSALIAGAPRQAARILPFLLIVAGALWLLMRTRSDQEGPRGHSSPAAVAA